MKNNFTRGAAMLWALWATVAMAMLIGVICRGLAVSSKYKTLLEEQTARQEVDNWATAKRIAERNGHSYARIEIDAEAIAASEFFACPDYPNNLLLQLLAAANGAEPMQDAVFHKESVRIETPSNANYTDEVRLDMGDISWKLQEQPEYASDISCGIMGNSLNAESGIAIPVYPQGGTKQSGICYALYQPPIYEQTIVAGGGDTFYNRGAGKWVIQAVDLETGQSMRELKLDTSAIPTGKYNNNHAWYLTANSQLTEKRYVVISDGAPVIVSPNLLTSAKTAPTLSIGQSVLIIGDLSDFPENP